MSIKYYRLAKDEELPDEFCAVRDVGGEPSEYVFYVPDAENAKLRKLVAAFDWCTENFDMPNKCDQCPLPQGNALEPECEVRMRELGIDVGEAGGD